MLVQLLVVSVFDPFLKCRLVGISNGAMSRVEVNNSSLNQLWYLHMM